MGKGGSDINIPPAPGPTREEMELLRMQVELTRALVPSDEDLALQRELSSKLLQQVNLMEAVTPEELREREELQIGTLTMALNQDVGERRAQIIEQANKFGLNPLHGLGQLEGKATLAGSQIRSGDALSRAMALLNFQQGGLQSYMQNVGLGSQLASAPFQRAFTPAAGVAGSIGNQQQQQYNSQVQLAMAQAQLAGQGTQGILSGLGGLGSLMGGAGGLYTALSGGGALAGLAGI